MKVLLLTDVNSPHSQKWLRGLHNAGVDVSCFSLTAPDAEAQNSLKGIRIAHYDPAVGVLGKLSYFGALPHLRRFIAQVKPDVLHAHYASSYGLLGALCKFQPFCISVWGSDVYEFPRRGLIQKFLLRHALKHAARCFSTSAHMAAETAKYREGPIEVIAFGVDTRLFAPKSPKPVGILNFATAKSLNPIYNIPTVVDAFAQIFDDNPLMPISLHIAGDGAQMEQCRARAGKYLDHGIHFYRRVAHAAMPTFFANKHVLINIPETESFGVSVVEASAAGLATIATQAGGLPEVVSDGHTGMLISEATIEALTAALHKFMVEPGLAAKMGEAAQIFAVKHYDWTHCLTKQMEAYDVLMSQMNDHHRNLPRR